MKMRHLSLQEMRVVLFEEYSEEIKNISRASSPHLLDSKYQYLFGMVVYAFFCHIISKAEYEKMVNDMIKIYSSKNKIFYMQGKK